MPATVVFGMQWGDEGKGRIVDVLAAESDVVVRYQGGANAGHTVIVGDEKYVLHILPSGVLHPGVLNVIGNGVVVDPWVLLEEVEDLRRRNVDLTGRLLVSDRAHVVLPYHKLMDRALEALRGDASLGTTSRGIGPAYADKYTRDGLRVGDLLRPDDLRPSLLRNVASRNEILRRAGMEPLDPQQVLDDALGIGKRLAPFVADTVARLHELWTGGRRLLFEGAQGFMLDVDLGTYPFVTSSSTGSNGVGPGTGLPWRAISKVLGVVKAYTTRVGSGPFPTEDVGPAGEHMGSRGREFGATTGRKRRCGWFDAVVARHAVRTQGVDAAALMKLDVLSGLDQLKVCTAYEIDGRKADAPPAGVSQWRNCRPVYETFKGWREDLSEIRRFDDLPREARTYVRFLEAQMGVPLDTISVGAERARLIRLETQGTAR
ncbi:MAG: adenylosuccinate synthase [Planctomycetes bacterium]|nr:adenylosuccinate synthase [Planctomycetota bacterium]